MKHIPDSAMYLTGLLLVLIMLPASGRRIEDEASGANGCGYRTGFWHSLDPAPLALASPLSAMADGRIYLFGGITGRDPAAVDDSAVWIMDSVTGTWSRSAAPDSHWWTVQGARSCVLNGWVFLMGGVSYEDERQVFHARVDRYDPASDRWERMVDMPVPLAWFGTCVLEGKIVVTGGTGTGGVTEAASFGYDPLGAGWNELPPMGTPRHRHAAEAIGGRICVAGGLNNRAGKAGLKSAEVFDPAQGTWHKVASVPVQVCDMASCVMDGTMWILGGRVTSGTGVLSSLTAYDPDSDSWRRMDDLPGKICQAAAEGGERNLYLIGGSGLYSPATRRAWLYELNDVILTRPIPDQRIEQESVVIDLSAHFAHSFGESLSYGICYPSDPTVALASIHEDLLILKGLLPGKTSLGVRAQSGTDTGGDEFLVDNRVTGQPDRSLCDYSQGTWHPLPALPEGLNSSVAAMAGGRLYLFGESGVSGDSAGTDGRIWIYDPAADSWDSNDPVIPDQRAVTGAGTAVTGARTTVVSATMDGIPATAADARTTGEKIYLIGGIIRDSAGGAYSARVDRYDPVEERWQRVADLPVPLAWFGVCTLGNRIYVTGGCSGDGMSRCSVYRYDPLEDRWDRLEDMHSPRQRHVSATVDGRIFAVGGINNRVSLAGLKNSEAYDPDSKRWKESAPVPTQICDMASFVVDEGLFLAGGKVTASAGVLSSVLKYFPDEDFWMTADELPGKWILPSAFPDKRRVYLLGGATGKTGRSAEFWKYEPDDVILKRPFPDRVLGEDSVVIDLSEYLVHPKGESITYTTCYISDPAILSATVTDHLLVMKGLYPGEATVGIMGVNGTNRISTDFDVVNTRYALHRAGSLSPPPLIHPGPDGRQVFIECGQYDRYGVRVTGTDGRQYAAIEFSGNAKVIDASYWPTGIYVIEVISGNGTYSEKLFKP